MEKEILQLLSIMMSDNLYRQVYAGQIKMLFDMLEREQSRYLTNSGIQAGEFGISS